MSADPRHFQTVTKGCLLAALIWLLGVPALADKKKDGWVTVTPMDDFSYDLQPTGKARKVSKSEEMIYGNAGLIKKDGIDE